VAETKTRVTLRISDKGIMFLDTLKGLRAINSFLISAIRYAIKNQDQLNLSKYLAISSGLKSRQYTLVFNKTRHEDVIHLFNTVDRASIQLVLSCLIEHIVNNTDLIKEILINRQLLNTSHHKNKTETQSETVLNSRSYESQATGTRDTSTSEDFDLGFLISR
jgi:hypothetical protein